MLLERNAVFPRCLCLIQHPVCALVVMLKGKGSAGCDADADGNAKRLALIMRALLFNAEAYLPGNQTRLLRPMILEQYGKFFSACAAEQRIRPDDVLYARAHFPKHLIARDVAEIIVDRFKIVYVKEDEAGFTAAVCQAVFSQLKKGLAVEYAEKAVMFRTLL